MSVSNQWVALFHFQLAMHCMPNHDFTKYLIAEFAVRPLNELLGMEVTETHVFSVPTYCVPL